MVLHMEVGNCPSGINTEKMEMIAGHCHLWPRFLDRKKEFPYGCPTCGERFRFMSGLLQHAESARCDENLDEHFGPLATFLRFLRAQFS